MDVLPVNVMIRPVAALLRMLKQPSTVLVVTVSPPSVRLTYSLAEWFTESCAPNPFPMK